MLWEIVMIISRLIKNDEIWGYKASLDGLKENIYEILSIGS